ncbi:MAG: hypothetical protein JWR01_1077 [Subtercola sp.]|nr:hypothetical protein [Subtercola sp.]
MDGPSAELSLCDLTVSGNVGSVSSHGLSPNASMMASPSVTSLLFALAGILDCRAKTAHAVFEATASPFTLSFRRSSKGIRTAGNSGEVDQSSVESFAEAARRDVASFTTQLIGSLPSDNNGSADLRQALSAFTRAVTAPRLQAGANR